MNHFIRLLGATLILIGTICHAQPGAPTVDAKFVPNVTGKNSSIGNIYSPNLFDGSANVNIPIYDFSNEFGNFGISFSYNTKGVKINELSGKAGLHWDINAGGNITRVMKDLPDEIDMSHTAPVSSGVTMVAKGRWPLYDMANIPSNIQEDKENDDFIVSVGSLNFTFKIGKDNYIFTHPNRRVKIQKTNDFNGLSFKIIDESGCEYTFIPGDASKTTIQKNDLSVLLSYSYTSRWVISKIRFSNGTEISYDYDIKSPPNTVLYVNNLKKEYLTINQVDDLGGFVTPFIRVSDATADLADLKSISYPNGIKASFIYDSANAGAENTVCATALKEIVISSKSDNCTRFWLDKAYHVSSHVPNSPSIVEYTPRCDFNFGYDYRMILRGIYMKSCDGTSTEPYYTFEYSPYRLHSRAGGASDRFGYNNDGDSTLELGSSIPIHPYNSTQVGVNRDVTNNINILNAANLVKVNNSFGGSVAFAYELHSGLSNVKTDFPNSDPLFLGQNDNDGVRLKSITQSDKFHPGYSKITTFSYSGGQRFLTGGYFHYLSDVTVNPQGVFTRVANKVSTFSVSAHQLISGSNHGYSNITEETKDQSGNLLNKKEYVFTNFKTGNELYFKNSGSKDYFQEPFTDKQYIKEWMIGLPLVTTEYDQNNLIVLRTTNTYSDTLDLTSAIPLQKNIKIMRARNGNNTNPFTDPIIAADTFLPYTGKSNLVTTLTEKFIDGGQTINDLTTYTYDNYNNPKTTTTRNSQDEYSMTEKIYNYDVVDGSGTGTLYSMKAAGIEKLIGIERWKLGLSNANTPSNKRLLEATITEYEYTNGNLRTKGLHSMSTSAPVPYSQYTGVSTNGPITSRYNQILSTYSGQQASFFKRASDITTFDSKGNPLETKLSGFNTYKAMVWDSVTGNKLADVRNARYSEIAFTSFEVLNTGASYPAGSIINEGRFLYQNSGINGTVGSVSGKFAYALAPNFSSISIGGISTGKTYIISYWTKNGKPSISGAGVTINCDSMYSTNGWTNYQGKFTPSNSGPLNFITTSMLYIDEVRLYPADAMMESWTFIPLCTGPTSYTDPAGRITYFEYDKFGRLIIKRDQEGYIQNKTQFTIN